MYTIAIAERRPALSRFLEATLPEALRRRHRLCPAEALRGGRADLLLIAPDLGRDQAPALGCRALLVPGRLSVLAGSLPADWAVSYGSSAKDSLTFSSFGETRIALALQREVVTLAGDCLPCQEIILPRGGHTAPFHVMASVGLQLLLGVPPEELGL